MLKIETRLGPSAIEGLGLFTRTTLPAGTVIWSFTPDVDQRVPRSVVATMPEPAHTFLLRYAWREGETYYLCCDDMRFMNHAPHPNVVSRVDPTQPLGVALVAARDIAADEELTGDYSVHDEDFATYASSMRSG